jgi:hypothetical protein
MQLFSTGPKSGPQGLALAIAPALEKDPRVHGINFWKNAEPTGLA